MMASGDVEVAPGNERTHRPPFTDRFSGLGAGGSEEAQAEKELVTKCFNLCSVRRCCGVRLVWETASAVHAHFDRFGHAVSVGMLD